MNKRQIHMSLMNQQSNLRQFALSKSYKPRTVTQAINRWAGSREFSRSHLTYKMLE